MISGRPFVNLGGYQIIEHLLFFISVSPWVFFGKMLGRTKGAQKAPRGTKALQGEAERRPRAPRGGQGDGSGGGNGGQGATWGGGPGGGPGGHATP